MPKSFLVTVTNDLNQDQRMHRICDSLVKEGNKVMLIGRQKSSSGALLDHKFDQKRLKCVFNKGFLFYLEYNLKILFFALKYKPDVYYSVDLDTLLGLGIAARVRRKKMIHDAHEYFVEVPELEGQKFKKWIWNFVGIQFIPKCDLCFTVNQELADILTKRYKHKFHVIQSVPNSIEGAPEVQDPSDIPVILYQGVLNKGRGIEESIRAVSQLNEKVTFKIAGEGDLSSELRALVNKLQVQDTVQFLGWLNPDELKIQTQNADIGLNLLSSKSLNYKYSLANKFFDYMHAGLPSINMSFPVYKRICGAYEVGLCIDSLEPETIQKAIRLLITDKEKVKHIKAVCLDAKTIFNWEIESKKLIDLIHQFA